MPSWEESEAVRWNPFAAKTDYISGSIKPPRYRHVMELSSLDEEIESILFLAREISGKF